MSARGFRVIDLSLVIGMAMAASLVAVTVSADPSVVRTDVVVPPDVRASAAAEPATTDLTSTTVPLVATFPLTGMPAGDAAVTARRAVAAKIDGLGGIPAVWGVEQSDMVVEEVVEGGLTRLIAIFQSRDPARIGPVRSVRTSDFGVLAPLLRPLLVFSGGNEGTVQMARSAPLLAFMPLSAESDAVFWRDPSLRAPHNLFASVPEIRSHAEQGVSPQPLFDFSSNLPVGPSVGSVESRLTWATTVGFRWDAIRNVWLRELNGKPQLDGTGAQLLADNVLMLSSPYGTSPFDTRSPEAQPIGTGPVRLYRNGTETIGTWTRANPADTWTLRTSDGAPMTLAPGRTWVVMAPGFARITSG